MADYHFPIALLQAPEDRLENLTLAWAANSRGYGLIMKQIEETGTCMVLEEVQGEDWFTKLPKEVQRRIINDHESFEAAWAADRARRSGSGRRCFVYLDHHLKQLDLARDLIRNAENTAKTRSPTVWIPPIAWERAFYDDTDSRDIAIRDFRVLCGLYSSIGKLPARAVRRSEIIKRAFGFWAKDHSEQMVQKRIRETLPNGFTPRMIRDSLDRLDHCGEIIRFPTSQTVTWYARGSNDAKPAAEYVYKRTMDGLVSRSRSPAAQMLLDKLKQEGTK